MFQLPQLLLHDYFDSGNDLPPIPSVIAANQGYLGTLPFDGLSVAITSPDLSHALSVAVMQNAPLDSAELHAILQPMTSLPGTNFALVFINKPADFFDDWTETIANFGKVAQACKDCGLKGIIFDNEQYLQPIGNYPDNVDYPARALADYIAQAQLRGKQIMQAMVAVYPEIQVISFFGDWLSEPSLPHPLFPDWASGNELIGPFFVGFALGKGPLSTNIDGGELYHLRTPQEFSDSYNWRRNLIASDQFNSPNIPPSFRPYWPASASIAYGVADRDLSGANLDLLTVKNCLTYAIANADRYVWFYPEQFGYLKAPVAGGAPQAWIDAIRQGKDAGLALRGGSVVEQPLPVTLSIASPLAGANLSGSVPIQVIVSSNVVHVEYTVDKTYLGAVNASPFSYMLNTRTLANGPHTITGVAYDANWRMQIQSVRVNVRNKR